MMINPLTPHEIPAPNSLLKGRQRDRTATRAHILATAQAILVDQGPSGLGVNAVARAAGVDKQLIYRYFGGLEGLLESLGELIADWWQEKLRDAVPQATPISYAALMEVLAARMLHIMRTEALAVQSTRWELTDTTGLIRSLSASRGRALGAWIARARGDLQPPAHVDAPAINALLVAAVSFIVLASQNSGNVIGLSVDDEATWKRIEMSLLHVIRTVYV